MGGQEQQVSIQFDHYMYMSTHIEKKTYGLLWFYTYLKILLKMEMVLLLVPLLF